VQVDITRLEFILITCDRPVDLPATTHICYHVVALFDVSEVKM